jgi:hypothetical protein
LAWNASTDNVAVARYEVVQNAAVVGGDGSTTFTATGLSPSTSYTFSIRARDEAGNISSPSNQVTANTLPQDTGGGGGQVPGRAWSVAGRNRRLPGRDGGNADAGFPVGGNPDRFFAPLRPDQGGPAATAGHLPPMRRHIFGNRQ